MKISYSHIDIAYREYENLTILYNLRTKEIMTLEDVAKDIWSIITKNNFCTLNSIQIQICGIYHCKKDEIENDIKEFINELYQDGFIMFNDNYYNQELELISTNINSDFEGEIIELMQKNNQIYSATFELTYTCNEKCIHCYANYPKGSNFKLQISMEKYKSLIDELYDMNCMHLAFTGGDPFMYKDFVELYKYARSKGFVCDIYTNAQYLFDNSVVLDEILKLRPRAFYISLYGATSETHDKITTIENSFNKTISVIKKISQKGVCVVVNIMLLNINYHEIEDIIALAKAMGVDYRIGMSLIYKNDGNKQPMKYFIGDKQVIKNIIKIENNRLYSIDIPMKDENLKSKYICGAGTTTIAIAPDGIVYPCVSLKRELGNSLKNSLKDIWFGRKREELIGSLVWKNTKQCLECKSQDECPHCIGMSQAEKGDMFECNTCDKIISECLYELKINE